MKQFQAPFIAEDIAGNDLERVSALLDLSEKQYIDKVLWSDNGYMPQVSFVMAYTRNSILLKYTVKERHFKAAYKEINDPVYKDSCVELFIAFDNDRNYYNLEFNGLGTVLGAYGVDRNDRTAIKGQILKKIDNHHVIKPEPGKFNGFVDWELTLNIPFIVFEHHQLTLLKNQVARVNFYKCGDDLPEPHFLSWNTITNPQPDFHLSQFFGEVKFA